MAGGAPRAGRDRVGCLGTDRGDAHRRFRGEPFGLRGGKFGAHPVIDQIERAKREQARRLGLRGHFSQHRRNQLVRGDGFAML